MSKKTRFDVTAFGEIMLRMSVPQGRRLELASGLDMHPGGAEGNMLASLACLGRKGAWVGGLPENPLGHVVKNHLRRANVNTDGIIWKQDARMGLFFIEFGSRPRSTQVYYDRANSAAATVSPAEIPWNILLDTKVIHLTGITPALSDACLDSVIEIIQRAREAGVLISFDINFRKKLWTESRAAEVLRRLIQGVDLLLCGRADAQALFGCPSEPEACVKSLIHLSHAKNVVVSLGDEGAIAWDRTSSFIRAEQGSVEIVDRIGAGDAMAAGILHGWLDGDLKKGLYYGMALAAIALTLEGDMVTTSEEEIQSILTGGGRALNR